jgi:hypothetical protein
MFYRLLARLTFTDPAIYNWQMEVDRSLVKTSPVYDASTQSIIDEYISLELLFTDILKNNTVMTKFYNSDKSDLIVQIECDEETSFLFRHHPSNDRFNLLRTAVGDYILKCVHRDINTVSATPIPSITSYEEGLALF